MNNSKIVGNTSTFGGGISSYQGSLTVQNSTISGNTGTYAGGVFSGAGTTATFKNSTISGNIATNNGGGLRNYGTITVQNSTISGNSAPSGGGVRSSGGTLTLQNSIIANSAGGGDCVSSLVSASDNLIEDSASACTVTNGVNGNIVGQDPALGALSGGVHVPASNSPVIDAGNTATPGGASPACLATDQRGQSRNDLRCDMGAVEVKLSDTDTVIKSVGGTGTFTFGPTLAKIVVTTQGSLNQLLVQYHSGNHSNATQMNGQWWGITPTGGGYTANLDLPHTVTPDSNAKVCKYVSDTTWDCARTGSDASRVWRDGITAFSDWAVGDNVGPNAITLRGFTASGGSGGITALWAAALAGLAGLGAVFVRRRLRNSDSVGATGRSPRPQTDSAPDPGRSPYQPPAIIHRGQLELRAGSPLALPDFIDPENPFP